MARDHINRACLSAPAGHPNGRLSVALSRPARAMSLAKRCPGTIHRLTPVPAAVAEYRRPATTTSTHEEWAIVVFFADRRGSLSSSFSGPDGAATHLFIVVPELAVTIEEDDCEFTDTAYGSPAESGKHHALDSRKGIITIWIRRGHIPDEKTPGYQATNKSSVLHLRPKKGRGRPTNE
ncbi:hypothetical protein EVAR_9767_1 [Eumeta japonica]|uniref:Uncharacterized protein n=1 Tax=Eumeta variegata TaxID=151549 RepID=A0A4C1U5E8_EUMVA|nr:hypothetical protein EVAR_9767_1 [Eumeta japonica]